MSPQSTQTSLPELGAQADALAAGAVSSLELVNQALGRVDATQATLNAFRCVRAAAARAEAEAADERLQAGDRLPLLGVPVAIKDDTDLSGETTAFGCAGTFEPKSNDAEVVRKLRAAGAIIVGKTNTPELGQWPLTEGPAFGATRNPWNKEHSPGGSSGGSAAAVAAGLVAGAVGSDGGGSVRIPAAWTGLVGIKPQRGRISTWPDPEAFKGLTCLGPLTRTVGDAALMLDAMAGNHAADLHRPPAPGEPYADVARRRDPGRLRIAISFRAPWSGVSAHLDGEVRAAVVRIGEVCASLGHEVFEEDPVYGPIGLTYVPRGTAGVREWTQRMAEPDKLDERTHGAARMGRIFGGPILAAARAAERPLQALAGRIFRNADVVLTPTTATPPPTIGHIDGIGGWETDKRVLAAVPYAWAWNVLGWPGINVPAGLTSAGLPTGAQLLGPANSEARLIALAGQLEDVERWHERRAPLAVRA